MNGHQRQKDESRQRIEEALFALIEEKDYIQITVSEIALRADVARRTFYRLYENKDDVIHGYFERLCGEYRQSYPPLQRYDLEQIAGDYFSFWHRYREILLKLYRCGLGNLVGYEISRASFEVIKKRIGSETLQKEKNLDYFIDYSVGGFIRLLSRWIESGMEETPEQYARAVAGAIRKVEDCCPV